MKKKNGFTLIELLAVIVILAIIALIATPIVLNLLEKSRVGSYQNSGYGLLKAAKLYYSNSLINDTDGVSVITFTCDGTKCESSNNKLLEISGTAPTSGSITINQDGEIYFGKKYVNNELKDDFIFYSDYKCIEKSNKIKCAKDIPVEIDQNKGIICGDGTVEDYENSNTCYIKSTEDMLEFATLTNSGKNFEGKNVEVLTNLDFTNKEFEIIGTQDSPFRGTLNGNGHTLSNITINGYNNVGMFGYNEGIIQGLNVKNITVNGHDNVAGIAAYNKGGTVQMINLSGTITGNTRVAGIVVNGDSNASSTIKDVIVNATISANTTNGYANGLAYVLNNTYGIVEVSTITGKNVCATYCTSGGYRKVATMDELSYNKLNTYQEYVQTIFAGANSNGYYFDYNNDKTDIIVKHISNDPIDNQLSGSGTAADPYIISTYDDMRRLALQTSTQGKYYSVVNDIDFTNKYYYVIGTQANPFKGTFNGNGHTLSNITINGYNYVGMFGYNEGTIQGLNVNNITVNGNNYVAGIAGQNKTGKVRMINLSGNITGNDYVAGIVSDGRYGSNSSSNVDDVIVNANVSANTTSGYAAGITYKTNGVTGIMESGNISGNYSYSTYYNISYVQPVAVINNKTTYITNDSHSTILDESSYNDLSVYQNYIKTTADSSGYYFDYNADRTDIIVKHS